MPLQNHIAPEIKYDEQLRPSVQEPWWQEMEERWNPLFPIINIKFAHDPDWRTRTMSIQNAHEWHKSAFWSCIALAYFVAQFAFPAIWVIRYFVRF